MHAQDRNQARKVFDLKGSVLTKEDLTPIPDAVVQILGYGTETTDAEGSFVIRARIGDELVVSHPSFKTVFYTLKSTEDVDIRVEDLTEKDVESFINGDFSGTDEHQQFLDSANFYKNTNISKSILFVENSIKVLGKRVNKQKAAASYATLGDIYTYWGQDDLATSNYESSLRYANTISVLVKLGKAQLASDAYDKAEKSFQEVLSTRKATPYHQVAAYEGLGDVYVAKNDIPRAISSYEEGLRIAQAQQISPKITDLNARLAEAYEQKGEVDQAKGLYSKSLQLAESESPKRSIQQKEKVADFYNRSNQYDEEIQLRKETLEEVEQLEPAAAITSSSANVLYDSITPQKINYKIGASYLKQQKLDEAIPFLENSIEQANEAEDLVVQKDATRRLSEVYESKGDFDKALDAYQQYVSLVDKLYNKKEQEISQISRFNRELANKQNRINSLEKDRELSESKFDLYAAEQQLTAESNSRKQLIIYGLLFGMLLLLVALFFMNRSIQQQRLNNNLLALRSLRSQMNPHFIFNALNSVNNYIALNDERNANRYLSEFSSLMRAVLENSEQDFIPLVKEIELLRLYVKLEHRRFEDKFDYEIVVDENIKTEDFVIPPMLLQPYVENAVWHGLRYKKEKGSLCIRFQQKNDHELTITITDDGIGRKRSKELKTVHQQKQKSTGMGNIKDRIRILNAMYKDKVNVSVEDGAENGEGTRVSLTLKKD